MRWARTLRLRLRSLFRSGRVEQELGDELQYHLDRLVDEFVRSGMRPWEARQAALREMGALEQRKEDCRDARGLALIHSIRQDVIYALRTMRRTPVFSAVAILSLALGIGASTAMFGLWNGVLYAPLPGVTGPGQLVMLTNPADTGMWTGRWEGRTDGPRSWVTYAEFEDLRAHASVFSSLMASQSSYRTWQARIDGTSLEPINGRLVSGAYFEVLGVEPAMGRLFTPEMDGVGGPEAVISYAYWQRRFAGRPDVLGRTFTIRSTPLTVIGVTPRGFVGETAAQRPDVWLPIRLQPQLIPGFDWLRDTPPEKAMWLQVFGRLKPGVTHAQAEAQANAIFQRGLESFYGSDMSPERRREFLDQRLQLQQAGRGASSLRNKLSLSLTALLAAVVVLLLIASANLANLLLARGAARRPEIALRLSLGASRRRIVRQLSTESLTLAMLGGTAAIVVARVLHDELVNMLAATDDRFALVFELNPFILAFAAGATGLTALLFGVLPALQVAAGDAGSVLKEHDRGTSASPVQMRSGRALVIVQLALSLPLLVGAGLLAQTVYNLQRADLGFPVDGLLLVRVDLREAAEDGARRDRLLSDLREELASVRGVRSVTYSQLGVFSGGDSTMSIEVEGYAPKGDRDRGSGVEVVGPGYFSTLGGRILAGRELHERDYEGALKVCVINEAFAEQFFGGRDPLGRHITAVHDDPNGTKMSWQIVGVASNVRTMRVRGGVEPRFFVPSRPAMSSANTPTYLIRTASDGAPVMAGVQHAIRRMNPALVIMAASTLEEQMEPELAQDRLTAQLAVVFGAVALTLAAIGLYGVLSYGVARRTGEIAIRMALGAPAERVLTMILRESVGCVTLGLAAGGALAFAASRLIGSRLYGIAPQDPITLVLATALLLVVALLAAYVPARRASRVDPAAVLR